MVGFAWMKMRLRMVVFRSVFSILSVTVIAWLAFGVDFTIKRGYWHDAPWPALGSAMTGVAALAASAATFLAVKGIRKSEKNARISMVRDIEAATREVFNGVTEVRTEVYKIVREVAISEARDNLKIFRIPVELKTAGMKFTYASRLLYLRHIDFSHTRHAYKFLATEEFTAHVMFLLWLERCLLIQNLDLSFSPDRGGLVKFNREALLQFFEDDFVNLKGDWRWRIQNHRVLELLRTGLNDTLDALISPDGSSSIEIIDSEPLHILVIAELMEEFSFRVAWSFEEMVRQLKIGFTHLFRY